MTRIDGRKQDELRPVEIIPNINKFAEGNFHPDILIRILLYTL